MILILLGVGLAAVIFFWPSDDLEPGDIAGRDADEADTSTPGGAEGLELLPPPDLAMPSPPPGVTGQSASADDEAETVSPAVPTIQPRPTVVERPPSTDNAAAADTPPAPSTTERPITERPPARPAARPLSSGSVADHYNRADQLIASGDPIAGRALLSRLLFAPNTDLSDDDAQHIRQRLDEVNQRLVWSDEVVENDPLASEYKVDGYLSKIGVAHRVPYQLLERINGLTAENLQLGRIIKVINGPLHARVDKSSFVMDVFGYDGSGDPIYVCSYPVGLGKDDKTPIGSWEVIAGSKVTNPSWRDDENGQYYAPDDPQNPIGEYWIAIEGTDAQTRSKRGFGIHGTIEPQSIGTEASRGCIRLADEDIKSVFYMLTDHSQGSTIQIVR